MKKIILVVTLVFLVFISLNSSVKMVSFPADQEDLIINCHTDYSIIIEFPKKVIIEEAEMDGKSLSHWTVDHDLNLLWGQPEKIDSPDCLLKIKTSLYESIKIRLRAEKDPKKLIHTIVLKESVFSQKKIQEEPEKNENLDQENPKTKQKDKKKSSLDIKGKEIKKRENVTKEESSLNEKRETNVFEAKIKNSFNFDTFIRFSGGTQSFNDSSFTVEGEIIVAAKNKSGLFFQGAGKTLINSMIKQYGFSVGAGFEPGKLGFFVFGDLLMHKFGEEFDSTSHFQIRPSLRYRLSDKIHIAGFYSIPLGAWQYTGIKVPGEPGFGYYNKSLSHAGLDLSVYFKKMFVDLRALIAEGSAFGIDFKAGYEFIKKIFITLNCSYATTGDYTYMEGITNSSRIGIGVTYSIRNFDKREKDRIIFRPDYPMVVVAEKELDDTIEKVSPAIALTADPTSGYAPLNVSYKATPEGFDGIVTMTWYFNTTYSTQNELATPVFEYNTPGTYQAWVEGRDGQGNYAKSNIVTITVLDSNSTDTYTIRSSVRSGEGTIDPLGNTVVGQDGDQKYLISAAEGWHIKNVYCDGNSVGSVSEYEFKKVCKDHLIEAEFTETEPTAHTITVSVKNNRYGFVSPGTTQVEDGSDISFIFTPDDNKQTVKYWVNGKLFNSEGADGYTFTNVSSDQTLEVEFDHIYYTIHVSLHLADGQTTGSINPGVGDFTQKAGTNATFNFNPGVNSEITKVLVNSKDNGTPSSLTFYNLSRDHWLEVYMERIPTPVSVTNITGCSVLIDSSTGQTGTGTYNMLYGDSLTLYFTPVYTSGTKDYYLFVDGVRVGSMPPSWTFNNLSREHNLRIKCVEPGDPPPM